MVERERKMGVGKLKKGDLVTRRRTDSGSVAGRVIDLPWAIRSHRIAAAEPSPEIAVRPAKPGSIAAHRSGAPRQVT